MKLKYLRYRFNAGWIVVRRAVDAGAYRMSGQFLGRKWTEKRL